LKEESKKKRKKSMALQSHNMNLTEPLAPNAEWVHESSAQVGFFFLLFIGI
jgi:hypothetical protein